MIKKKVLIVDDEESLRRLISLLLTPRGYNVLEAHDGITALACVKRDKPDLVLLDIMMPGINGFDVCQAIKNDEAIQHIPIVMLTAQMSSEHMVRADQAGADQYITKPFSSAYLLETIRQTLYGAVQ